MKYTESNNVINASQMIPTSNYDPNTFFEFSIIGKNTYNKDIYYEIELSYGDPHETRKTKLDDKFLRFRLEEIKGDEVTPVIEEGIYEDLNNRKIWVNTIDANTDTETEIKYKLYMWITDEVKIGDTSDADYSKEVWNNDVYASVKVNVSGDFVEKSISKGEVELKAYKLESGEEYDLESHEMSDEDIKIVISSTKEIKNAVLTNISKNTKEELEPKIYEGKWNVEKVISASDKFSYYIVYKDGELTKSKNFEVSINPDRYTLVDKPTNAVCIERIYNGETQELVSETESYTLENNKQVNAGEYQITAKLKDKYRWSDKSTNDVTIECSLTKKDMTITASNQTITYGSSISKTPSYVTTSDLVEGHSITSITLSQSTTSVTSSGTITASNAKISDSASTDVTNNYDIKYKSGTLKINARTATMGSCYSRTYNGVSQTIISSGTGVTYSSSTASVSGSSVTATDAGSYTITGTPQTGYKFSDNSSFKSVTCSIAKKEIKLHVEPEEVVVAVGGTTQFNVYVDSADIQIGTNGTGRATILNSSVAKIFWGTNEPKDFLYYSISNSNFLIYVQGIIKGTTEIKFDLLIYPNSNTNYTYVHDPIKVTVQ